MPENSLIAPASIAERLQIKGQQGLIIEGLQGVTPPFTAGLWHNIAPSSNDPLARRGRVVRSLPISSSARVMHGRYADN